MYLMFGRKLGVVLVTFSVAFFLFSPRLTLAVTNSESETLRKKVITQRCERVTGKISDRILRWDNNEPEKHRLYNNIVARVQKMINNLKKKGYDTSELETSLANLNEAIVKRHEDATTLINLIKDTQNYACGESEGKFTETLKKTQDQWKVFHQDTLNIKNIWQNEVRPAIRKLKEQRTDISPTVVSGGNEPG